MKRTQRVVLALVAVTVAVSFVVSACGSNTSQKAKKSSSTAKLAPYQIVFTYLLAGPPPKDLPLVQAALDKITQAKFNATVLLKPINIPQYNTQLHLKLQSGQKLDVVMAGDNNGFSSLVSQGLLLPMDSLMAKYGQGITKTYADAGLTDFLNVGKINGKRYGIPTIRGFASADGFEIGVNMAHKYGIDISKIKTVADMTAALKTIKEKDPSVTPLELTATSTPASAGYLRVSEWDNLGDNLGVLMLNGAEKGGPLKVVDLYETPQYAAICQQARQWYLAGYINKDAMTANVVPGKFIGAGKAFATVPAASVQPTTAPQESIVAGTPVATPVVSRPVATTSTSADIMLAIPKSSKDPARAMMFLNLLYTDPQVVNLLDYGIKGRDYVMKSSTSVGYPSGVTQQTDGYVNPLTFQIGDEFLSYTNSTDEPDDLWKQLDTWDKNAVKSPSLGFLFNPEPVKTQYAALTADQDQYAPQLQTGSVDPQKVLPEFIAKLKADGIDKVIAEKQKQLNAWLKYQQQ